MERAELAALFDQRLKSIDPVKKLQFQSSEWGMSRALYEACEMDGLRLDYIPVVGFGERSELPFDLWVADDPNDLHDGLFIDLEKLYGTRVYEHMIGFLCEDMKGKRVLINSERSSPLGHITMGHSDAIYELWDYLSRTYHLDRMIDLNTFTDMNHLGDSITPEVFKAARLDTQRNRYQRMVMQLISQRKMSIHQAMRFQLLSIANVTLDQTPGTPSIFLSNDSLDRLADELVSDEFSY